ncbi:titin-like [Rhipicephalus sanguineus]|uniref:titin-like n=1 Tax=Rhipicephalus sanguineus TaxID=34632 RepID=UPI0020C44672|nr:titin-like [Rhipicephalus sanguineus]
MALFPALPWIFGSLIATVDIIHSTATAQEAPRLQPFYFPKDHPLLETLVVSCIAIRGTQPVQFAWFKDGLPVNSDGGRAVPQQLSATLSTLTISQVTAQDVGNYTCRASNEVGSDSYSAELLVTDQPRIQPLAFPPSVSVGQEVSVTCVAALGRKPFRFAWMQDGQFLVNNERKYFRTVVDNVVMLTIERVTADDVGNYTCTVTNGFGSDSATAPLIVEVLRIIFKGFAVVVKNLADARDFPFAYGLSTERVRRDALTGSKHSSFPPEIQPFAFSRNTALGQRATVACVVIGGAGPFRFAWSHNNRPVSVGNGAAKYIKEDTENIATLTLEKVSAEDLGNYTCTVTNAHGSDSYTASLVVEGLPAIMPFSFPENVRLGQKITVMCVVSSGAGPFRYAWKHGGTALTDSSRKHVKVLAENAAALTIEAVGAEDFGNYTCTVSNTVGSATYAAALFVEVLAYFYSSAPPVIMPISFAKDVSLGDRIALTCAVTRGTGPFEIRWTHDGKPIGDTKKTKYATAVTESITTMTIEKVQPGDMGNYTCTVTNDVGRDAVTATLLVEEAPQIQPFAFPKDPRANSKIVVSCNAHVGTEPISFAWFKNGQRVTVGTKVNAKVLSETVSILTLLDVSAEDVGNYTCQATNRFGTDSVTAGLALTAEPPKIQPFSFPTNLVGRMKVIVYCAVLEGSEPLIFSWTKDGHKLVNKGRLHVKQLSETGSSLTITTVGAEDIGNYTCTVSNVAGYDSATSELLVKDPPRLQPFYFPKEHPPGDTVVVTCVASRGSQPIEFVWLKNGVHLGLGSEKAVPKMFTESVSVLTIPEVSAADVANYTCRASNAAGSDSYTAELIVTEGPKIQPFSFPNDAQLGKEAAVSCFAVRGHQPLKFSWLKNGVRVDGISNVEAEEIAGKISTLTLKKVSAADIGNYTCRVSNVAGTDEFTTSLVVNVEPPKVQPFSFPTTKAMPKKVVVHCSAVEGSEPFEFSWIKDGARLESNSRMEVKQLSETLSTLTINKAGAEDIGNYTCIVRNAAGSDAATSQLLVTEAPQIQPFAFPKDPRANSKIVVSCSAHIGTEPISFAWFKNGQRVVSGTKVQVKAFSETVNILALLDVTSDDAGNYTCRATNSFGTDSLTAELVLTDVPKIQPFFFPKNHPMGKDVTVSCFASEGQPPLSFSWLKDGAKIVSGSKFAVKQPLDKMSTLTIHEVAAADIGNYTCEAKNDAGRDRTTASLVITDAPRVQPFVFPRESVLGETLMVMCVANRGAQPMQFSWLKNGVALEEGNKATPKMFTESVSALSIRDVGAEDVANYTCRATNSAGSDSYTAELVVTDAPKIQPFAFPSDEQLGKDVTVSCFAMRGHQPLKFSWLKNGARVESTSDVEEIGGKMSTLTVRQLSAADFGNYTCRVSNAAGTDEFTTTLVVNVEPPRIQPFNFPTSKAMPKKVVVHCVVIEGSEPFELAWLRDGARLPSSNSDHARVRVKQVSEAVSSLTIFRAGAEDIGNYTCVATNSAGSDSVTSELLVTVKVDPAFRFCKLSNRFNYSHRILHSSTDVPKLVPFSFPKEQQIGAAVAVTCIASRGTQPLIFTWLKDGLPIDPRGKAAPKTLSESISALTIARVHADDVANYTCRVENDAGSDSYTAELVVAEPPKLQPLALPRNPALNKKLVLSCVATEGDPPLEFAWTKDGLTEPEGKRYSTTVLASHISSLTILELTAQDVGNYTCHVSNSAGTDSSTASLVVHASPCGVNGTFEKSAALSPAECFTTHPIRGATCPTATSSFVMQAYASPVRRYQSHSSIPQTHYVSCAKSSSCVMLKFVISLALLATSFVKAGGTEAPKVLPFSFPKEHRIGDALAVTCVASRGSRPLAFAWLKNGAPVTSGHKAAPKMLTESISALTMSSVDADDIANYTCRVTNAAGSDSYTAELVVAEPPKLQPFVFPRSPLLKKKVVVSCVAVEGDAPLQFTWSKDGGAERDRKRYTVDTLTSHISSLTIPEVTAQDIGNYTCRVSNAAGTDSFTASLLVQGQWCREAKLLLGV